MTENELMTLLRTVTPPDESARAAAHAHWAALAKPLGGLGALETMIEDAAALTGNAAPAFAQRAVLVPGVPWCRSIWELRVHPWRVPPIIALPPAPAILPQDRP